MWCSKCQQNSERSKDLEQQLAQMYTIMEKLTQHVRDLIAERDAVVGNARTNSTEKYEQYAPVPVLLAK